MFELAGYVGWMASNVTTYTYIGGLGFSRSSMGEILSRSIYLPYEVRYFGMFLEVLSHFLDVWCTKCKLGFHKIEFKWAIEATFCFNRRSSPFYESPVEAKLSIITLDTCYVYIILSGMRLKRSDNDYHSIRMQTLLSGNFTSSNG